MSIGPVAKHPQGPGGYVIMVRFGPDLWDFHPSIYARFDTLTDALVSMLDIPASLESRVYSCRGGNLVRVR